MENSALKISYFSLQKQERKQRMVESSVIGLQNDPFHDLKLPYLRLEFGIFRLRVYIRKLATRSMTISLRRGKVKADGSH